MRTTVSSLVCVLAAGAFVQSGQLDGPRESPDVPDGGVVLERFLAKPDGTLLSYRSLRRLEAAARGGKMQASLTAWTSFDPEQGFEYEVIEESGSGLIRSKVLRAALEAERRAKQRDEAARGALSRENYEFSAEGLTDGLIEVAIRPRRRDTMLIQGKILLTREEAELVQVEGLLVKRPSFWTRKVEVVRRYAQIGGVHVPVAMDSTADVLLGGRSTFSMSYEYATINGLPVEGLPEGQPGAGGLAQRDSVR
jgi:hypothetical protein